MNTEDNAVTRAQNATDASNERIAAAVSALIADRPEVVAQVRALLQENKAEAGGSSSPGAKIGKLLGIDKLLIPLLVQAASIGVTAAAPLSRAINKAVGKEDNQVAEVLTAAAAGTAVAVGVSGSVGSSAASAVASAAKEKAVDAAVAAAHEKIEVEAVEQFHKVSEYQAKIEKRQEVAKIVETNPDAVSETGDKLSLSLRGAKPVEPVVDVAEEEALDFLEAQIMEAAQAARREAEVSAVREVHGSEAKFVLVAEGSACKICKTLAGSGFLVGASLFIHKNCGCSLQRAEDENDEVYKYNKETYGSQYDESVKLAVERWGLTEEAAGTQKYFALTLGEAAKTGRK